MIEKHVCILKVDFKCDIEFSIDGTIAARNALINNSDFSPNQPVFGHNLALPNVFENGPTALEPMTALSCKIVKDTLQTINSVRQEFIRAESCE